MASPGLPDESVTQWIPFRGWSYLHSASVALGILIVVALGSWAILFGVPSMFSNIGLWLVEAFIVIGALAPQFLIAWRIGTSHDGVTVTGLGQRVFVPWQQLAGFGPQAVGKAVTISCVGGKPFVGAFTVSPEQARAILSHPSCPALELTPAVRTRLENPS